MTTPHHTPCIPFQSVAGEFHTSYDPARVHTLTLFVTCVFLAHNTYDSLSSYEQTVLTHQTNFCADFHFAASVSRHSQSQSVAAEAPDQIRSHQIRSDQIITRRISKEKKPIILTNN